MTNFRNLKIAINDQQPLDEVVMELERLGYVEQYRKPVEKNHKWILVENRGCYSGWYDIYVLCEKTYIETTLAELKEM